MSSATSSIVSVINCFLQQNHQMTSQICSWGITSVSCKIAFFEPVQFFFLQRHLAFFLLYKPGRQYTARAPVPSTATVFLQCYYELRTSYFVLRTTSVARSKIQILLSPLSFPQRWTCLNFGRRGRLFVTAKWSHIFLLPGRCAPITNKPDKSFRQHLHYSLERILLNASLQALNSHLSGGLDTYTLAALVIPFPRGSCPEKVKAPVFQMEPNQLTSTNGYHVIYHVLCPAGIFNIFALY